MPPSQKWMVLEMVYKQGFSDFSKGTQTHGKGKYNIIKIILIRIG